jgi:phosphocarrier protein
VRIVNKLGLHARAAARFVDLASDYRSKIEIRRGDDLVDGKSILGILTLAAPRGTELELVAEGEDANEALSALSTLIETGFGEEA